MIDKSIDVFTDEGSSSFEIKVVRLSFEVMVVEIQYYLPFLHNKSFSVAKS